ncbi:MAG TPA: ATP-binding protein [Nitrospirales bacterium]|nr:ATP-binding protein [Nitrospirales bacterium]
MSQRSVPSRRFISLRTKFVVFISLIIFAVGSSLSWYFVTQRRELMTNTLINTGSLLAKNLAHNSRYGLFTEDQVLLGQFIGGVMEVREVVYVIITGPEGRPLAASSKGKLTGETSLARSQTAPLYPAPALARVLYEAVSSEPVIAPFTVTGVKTREERGSRGKAGEFIVPVMTGGEQVYDFAVPVMRRGPPQPLGPELEPTAETPSKVYGVVQVGLTGALMQQALTTVIWNAALITVLIILGGIAATIVLAGRIITPLRSLAGVASRVAQGDLTASVEPSTRDEVGQLTGIFNEMTQSLKDRDLAISSQIQTIRKQVQELTALNQAGAAITSTLDLDRLLTTVLHLLVEKLGFARAILMLYDGEQGLAFGVRTVGVPEGVEQAAGDVEIPIQDDGSIHAEVLLHGKAFLIQDIATVADRMYPLFYTLSRHVGVTSYVVSPLKSKERILGFVAADRGPQTCAQEDLDLLMTIASHIAVAIDNARAYNQLEQLTGTLERRVRERTQELQSANEKLQELDRLKSAFVSMVSHELRTPMTSIKGYVENMLDGLAGAVTEKQAHYLMRVKHNVERLTRMINELLDLSRIEAGAVELHLGPVSIRELVDEAVEVFQRNAREKSVALGAHHADVLPGIQGDRDKLLQVLTNLIQNAVKFTPSGGTVRVESRLREDQFVEVAVADTGYGIPPHEIDKVFGKFYRGESVPAESRGAGLGLAISKNLVELHGGRIGVTSTTGVGSRFFFTVPIPRA